MRPRAARPCPVEGCDNERDGAHLTCRRCWYTIPKPLRDQVWDTYRRGLDQRYFDAADEAIAAAERAHREAVHS